MSGKIRINTSRTFSRPWLLSEEALSELDDIFNEFDKEFSTKGKSSFKAEAKKYSENVFALNEEDKKQRIAERLKDFEKDDYRKMKYSVSRLLKINISSDKSIEFNSFREASTSHFLDNEKIKGFDYTISYQEHKIRIYIPYKRYIDKNLYIDVSPSGDKNGENYFQKTTHWAEKHKTNIFISLLHSHFIFSLIIFIVIWNMSTNIIERRFDTTMTRSDVLSERANQIIKKGITGENINEAVEILLRSNFKIYPEVDTSTQSQITLQYIIISVLTYIFGILLIITPRFSIAVGSRGKKSYKRWSTWKHFLWVSLPILILGAIVSRLIA